MNRFVLLFFLFLISIPFSRAQSFKGGLCLGINGSQVSGDMLGGFNKPGMYGGFTLSHDVGKKSQLEMRLVYSGKGSRDAAIPSKGKYTSYLMQLHYIEVPFLYKIKYKKIWAGTGLSAGVLVASKVSNENGQYPEGHIEDRPFIPYELSYHFNLGLPFGNKWTAEAAICNSILPVRKHASNAIQLYTFNLGQYNTVVTFMLKYNLSKPNQE